MPLRIANNIASMNTQRWLGVADGGMKQSLERLSSGYRINKAADDAAGLAISSAFRADIASFKVASRNTSEAGSMLQVAEGAMDQMNNMLVRLKELATQAASGNVGDTERSKIDSEAQKLILEIDRLADATQYGSTNLLNGDFGGKTGTATDAFETLVDGDYKIYSYTESATTNTVTITSGSSTNMAAGTWTLATGVGNLVAISSGSVTATATLTTDVLAFTELGLTLTYAAGAETANILDDTIAVAATGLSSTSWSVDSDATATTYTIGESATGDITLNNGTNSMSFQDISSAAQTLDFSSLGVTLTLGSDYDATAQNLNGMTLSVGSSTTKTFQIGTENNTDNRLEVALADTTTGSSGLDIESLSLSSSSTAQTALTTIDDAISTLASRRGDIGGYMNRLSYASANLASTIENVQAAESVIRDVDMAAEMTEFTKNQILLQAGTAMLAQANMAPQQVLSLFG